MTSSKQKQSSIKTKEPCDIRKSKKGNVPQEANETFAKSEKKVSVKSLSNNTFNSFHDRYKQRSTTNFREVADRKKRNGKCCSILPPSNSNSPSSWYIPRTFPAETEDAMKAAVAPRRAKVFLMNMVDDADVEILKERKSNYPFARLS